jgi:hypothetical protein
LATTFPHVFAAAFYDRIIRDEFRTICDELDERSLDDRERLRLIVTEQFG